MRLIILILALLGLHVSAGDLGINLKACGAVGDGKADDTAALRRAIEQATAPDGPLQILLPPGVYRVTETIQLLPAQNNLVLIGSGGIGGRRAPTTILYDGPADGHLLDLRAHQNLQMRNLALDGGGKAGALLRFNSLDPRNADQTLLKRLGQRAATGLFLELVRFENARTGILIGDDSMYNGDCSTFINLQFSRLETGVRMMADQNLTYRFERTDFGYVGTCFHITGGGYLEASVVNTHHSDVVFRIEKTGINSGVYKLDLVRAEQGARTPGKRPVTLMAEGESNISMTGLQTTCCAIFGETGDRETPALILGPSANVLVQASQICGNVAKLTGAADQPATWLTFANSRFRCMSNPLESIVCSGNAGYRLRDCQIAQDAVDAKGENYKINGHLFVADQVRLPETGK